MADRVAVVARLEIGRMRAAIGIDGAKLALVGNPKEMTQTKLYVQTPGPTTNTQNNQRDSMGNVYGLVPGAFTPMSSIFKFIADLGNIKPTAVEKGITIADNTSTGKTTISIVDVGSFDV